MLNSMCFSLQELYALVRLYHEHNAVAGQQLGTMEDDIWQEIIEARTKLDQRKRAMQVKLLIYFLLKTILI